MNNHLARFLLQHSPWQPFWSHWMLGFITVGSDGGIYTTHEGVAFLDWIDLDHRASEIALASSGQGSAEDASAYPCNEVLRQVLASA